MSGTLTTKEAALRLGISTARIRQMVLSGQLPAEKFGRDLMIKETDLELVTDRKLGRPPKSEEKAQDEAIARGQAPVLKPKARARKKARKSVKKGSAAK